MNRRDVIKVAMGGAFCGVVLSACSGSFSFGTSADESYLQAGVDLIEGELADQIDLGPLDATCSGTELEAGDPFECSAQAGDLGPILFVGTIDADEEGVTLNSTNLLLANQVEDVEAFAASLIADETAVPIGPEHFECADSSIIVSNGDVMDCLLTDPTDGTVYEAPVTMEDLETTSVVVNIGDPVG